MFEYDFMRTAFEASGATAVLAGIVGYFLVLRGQIFAGHALSNVGFTGATECFGDDGSPCHPGTGADFLYFVARKPGTRPALS